MSELDTRPGAPGGILQTDELGGAHWQYVKVAFGKDGEAKRVTTEDPMPVVLVDHGALQGIYQQLRIQTEILNEISGLNIKPGDV